MISLYLLALDKKNELRRKINLAIEQAAMLKAGIVYELASKDNEHLTSSQFTKAIRLALERDESSSKNVYPRELYEYLAMDYTLLDVEATIFPSGLKIPFTSYCLPVGIVEDYLLFISNKHMMLSCIFKPVNSPVGGINHIQMYLVKSALAFSLAAIIAPLIKNAGFTYSIQKSLQISFNLFCVTPLAIAVTKLCLFVTSAFTSIDAHDPTFKLKHPLYSFFIISMSRLSLLIITGLVLLLLVLASVFSYHSRTITFIRVYVVEVLIPSAVIECFLHMLPMYPYNGTFVYLFGKPIFG